MKQVDVEIMGQSYRLSCPEGGEPRLFEAVARVDSAMCKIRDGGKIRARDRIAVLAALNLAFDSMLTHPSAPPKSVASEHPDLDNPDRYHPLLARLDAALQTETLSQP